MTTESTAVTAYCVKCRAHREITEGEATILKNGHNAIKGKCGVCGTTMLRMTAKPVPAEA